MSVESEPRPRTEVIERKDPLVGAVLHGVRLEEVIGRGSAASVYRGRHQVLGKVSAVKVLSARCAQSPEIVARFEREAKALAAFDHPNVVSVRDYGLTPAGRPFLAMDLLVGRTLLETLREDGPMSPREAASIALDIVRGLSEAHARGLVHRDLKPSNVMLVGGPSGTRAVILDFGIARVIDHAQGTLTNRQVLLGTPAYMAPEQAKNPTTATSKSDLYALGVMIYEMITGYAPFDGDIIEVIEQHCYKRAPSLRPAFGLESLVAGLLKKSEIARPGIAEVESRLVEILGRLNPGAASRPAASASASIDLVGDLSLEWNAEGDAHSNIHEFSELFQREITDEHDIVEPDLRQHFVRAAARPMIGALPSGKVLLATITFFTLVMAFATATTVYVQSALDPVPRVIKAEATEPTEQDSAWLALEPRSPESDRDKKSAKQRAPELGPFWWAGSAKDRLR